MKIAILSDLHLGYRQYGSLEREEDFYIQYIECMRQIKQENVDIVIIAGDIFDKANPSPKAMDIYRKGISSLEGIPVYTITGNHTMLMRDDHYTVDNYFSESGIDEYYLIDDSIILEKDFDITGLIYRSDSDLEDFHSVREDLLERQSDSFQILVIHQAIKEYCGFTGAELSIKDLEPENYDLIVCGHIHSPLSTKIGSTLFVQPGSIERMNTTEAADEIEKGKGFFIYDTDSEDLVFNTIESPRKFLLGDIQFDGVDDIENHFAELQEKIDSLCRYPLISYNYYDNTGSMVHIRQLMKNLTGVLINNSNIYDQTNEVPTIEINEGELPTVLEAIDMVASEVLDEKSVKLAKDIFEAYDNNNEENIQGLLDNFFNKNYDNTPEISEEDFLKMENDIKEYEEFFENLGGQ